MAIVMTILSYLILPIGWVFSFWTVLSFWSPTAYNICKGAANGVYATSRGLRQAARSKSLSDKAKR